MYDAKGLNTEERVLHTLPPLAKSALKIYEYSHPATYSELCNILVQRFSDKHDRFHRFQDLVALWQQGGGLDAYMDKFMELHAQVPDMSPHDYLAIYSGGGVASRRRSVSICWAHSMCQHWRRHWKRRVYMRTRTVVLWYVPLASMRLGTTPWI